MSNETTGTKERTPEDIAQEVLNRIGGYVPDYQRAIFKILADGAAESIAEAELDERIQEANDRICRAEDTMSIEQTEALAELLENIRSESAFLDFTKFYLMMRTGIADNDPVRGDPVHPDAAA